MTQCGTVRRIEGEKVWVEVNHKEHGDGEPLMACCSDASTTIEARNAQRLELKTGDSVKLVTPSGPIALAVLLGFVVPFALFIAAYLAAAPLFGVSAEGAKAGIGFAGLLIGSIVPLVYFRRRKPADGRPVVHID